MKPGFFIDRPIFSAVLSIVIVLGGFIGGTFATVGVQFFGLDAMYINPSRRENIRVLPGSQCRYRFTGGGHSHRTGIERNTGNVIHGIE